MTEAPMKPDTEDATQGAVDDRGDCPSVVDTYASVYAITLVLLVPGALLLELLPFRTYTFTYVSLVTMPFVLGLVLTFITDSRDSLKTLLIRAAVLTPLAVATGVAVMFLSIFLLIPVKEFLGPEYRAVTTPVVGLLLAALASPLVIGIVRRARMPFDWRHALQALAMVLALVVVGLVMYLSLFAEGKLEAATGGMRKDIVIYIVGAVGWYLPSIGVSAGVWRRLGMV